jgi:hypothetical protein
VEAWVALVTTTAGTIGGAVTGAVIALKGARSLSRDEREAAARAETLRAYRLFVGEAVKSVAELRRLPPAVEPNALEKVGEFVDRLGRSDAEVTMRTRARVHERYGDRHLVLADEFAVAAVDLRLRELPTAVRAAVDAAADYVARFDEQRSDELTAEWKDVHARLNAAGEELRRWAAPHSSPHTLPTNDDGQRRGEALGEG